MRSLLCCYCCELIMIMYKLIAVLCFLANALGVLGSNSEPLALRKLRQKPMLPDERIVGGVEIDIREVPYIAGIEYGGQALCGAILISETHLLTAGHCVKGAKIEKLIVRIGSNTTETGGRVIRAKSLHPHPLYKLGDIDYDAGIIELAEKAPLSDSVKIIPVSEVEAPVNTTLRVSGRGTTSPRTPASLRSVYIPVISRTKCQDMYGRRENITDRMICAHSLGKDPCHGDSGGPAEADGKIYGIVSWSYGCASPDYPGVYTNVGNKEIRDFIRKQAKV